MNKGQGVVGWGGGGGVKKLDLTEKMSALWT